MAPSLSPEEELLVLAARLDLAPRDKARIEEILVKGPDWALVGEQSERLGVQGLLYRHLSRDGWVEHVPEETIRSLKEYYAQVSLWNLRVHMLINSLLSSPAMSDMPLVLLKGAFLANWVYRDMGLRPMHDVDLLCRHEDLEILCARLAELGFSQEHAKSSVHAALSPWIYRHLPVFHHPSWTTVELHLHIFCGRLLLLDAMQPMEGVWKRTKTVELLGHRLRSLAPEDLLLYLVLHLVEHFEVGAEKVYLFWFCDIHEVIRLYADTFDWPLLLTRAGRLGAGEQMVSLLKLMREHWGTPVPESVLRGLGGDVPALCLTDMLRKVDNSGKQRSHLWHEFLIQMKCIVEIRGPLALPYYLFKTVFPDRRYFSQTDSNEDPSVFRSLRHGERFLKLAWQVTLNRISSSKRNQVST